MSGTTPSVANGPSVGANSGICTCSRLSAAATEADMAGTRIVSSHQADRQATRDWAWGAATRRPGTTPRVPLARSRSRRLPASTSVASLAVGQRRSWPANSRYVPRISSSRWAR
jgi:hypothetical protein